MNILLFAGTGEGRRLAERLAPLPVAVTVCVATEYGGDLLQGLPDRFRVLVGRMDRETMRDLMTYKRWDFVVDATHPYAVAASANIHAAASVAAVPLLRLQREARGSGEC
ncbi:MAG: precorrin-6A/cobalt-precorrin-6A reductase, partial [Planctomycetes bacterium]|nr:precorrin-6A/cobalt-precorrin-6A reductase [Planctomycetota bacterium]